MTRALRRHSIDDDASVDMTPMLDIVFIMLIFFIVTATFLDEKGIDFTQQPQGHAGLTPNSAVIVYIDKTGTPSLNGIVTEPSAVANRVSTLMADGNIKSVIIQANSQANMATVVTIKDDLALRRIPSVLKIDPEI